MYNTRIYRRDIEEGIQEHRSCYYLPGNTLPEVVRYLLLAQLVLLIPLLKLLKGPDQLLEGPEVGRVRSAA